MNISGWTESLFWERRNLETGKYTLIENNRYHFKGYLTQIKRSFFIKTMNKPN